MTDSGHRFSNLPEDPKRDLSIFSCPWMISEASERGGEGCGENNYAKEELVTTPAGSEKRELYCTCGIELSRCSGVIEPRDSSREDLEIPNFCIL